MSKVNKIKLKHKACSRCEKEQAIPNYYNTSDKNIFPDAKIPICKTCCALVFEEDGFEGFKTIMKLINKPIYEELFKGNYSDYIRIVNSMPQYRGSIFEDSNMFRESKANELINKVKPKQLTEDDFQTAREFWGFGYEETEYIYLNVEYTDYLNRYEVDTKTLENLIREICLVQLDIRIARAGKSDVKNELKAYNDLLTAANLKPSQESSAESSDQQTYGTWIKKLENDRPISKPDPTWSDVDGIGKYIRTFFLGNMLKAFQKENPYEDEYKEEMGKDTVYPHREEDD